VESKKERRRKIYFGHEEEIVGKKMLKSGKMI
jgi:hypothetical protein